MTTGSFSATFCKKKKMKNNIAYTAGNYYLLIHVVD